MNKDKFDVLSELKSLPPASFASQNAPITKIFFTIRNVYGKVGEEKEVQCPPIALSILLDEQISLLPKIEYNEIRKIKEIVYNRFYLEWNNFQPRNNLEKWLCFFASLSPQDNGSSWIPIYQNFDDLKRMHIFEVSLNIWNTMNESGLDKTIIAILWLQGFFLKTSQSNTTDQQHSIDISIPGICNPRLSTERLVIAAMNDIENKPNWKIDVFDETIIERWKEKYLRESFTDSMFKWMIEALKFKALKKNDKNGIEMAPPATVFQSDSLVNEELQLQLKKSIDRKSRTNPILQNWEPGSNGMVLNIVDPSMYCLALRRSHFIDPLSRQDKIDALSFAKAFIFWYKGGSQTKSTFRIFDEKEKTFQGNKTIPTKSIWLSDADKHALFPQYQNELFNNSDQIEEMTDHRYQWLPTDVRIDSKGNKAKFLSYLNNLKDERLESLLEGLVSKFVPIFEEILTAQAVRSLQHNVHGKLNWENFLPENPTDLSVNRFFDIKSLKEFRRWKKRQIQEGKQIPPCPPLNRDLTQNDAGYIEDDEMRHWLSIRKFKPPEVRPFVASIIKDEERQSLKDRTIQIIFKIESIELTPEKPKYEGGSWQVEESYTEQICAIGIYSLENLNITEPKIHFRQKVNDRSLSLYGFDLSNNEGLNNVFGDMKDDKFDHGKSFVDFGHVFTKEKRAIAFSSSMQYKFSPFELIDLTKSGRKRMIVMYLVKPDSRVTSTAEVPLQKCSEREAAVAFDINVDQLGKTTFGNLPFDISHLIFEDLVGKSQKAFEDFKKILENDRENDRRKAKNPLLNSELYLNVQRDNRILKGMGTEEDIESQQIERFKESIDYSAPMTFEEASWHRERLLKARRRL